MTFEEAMRMAERSLLSGATLEELREAVRDLRTLSPNSALADLVEARIERILSDTDERWTAKDRR
jgi:hypothetical protein